MSKRLIRAVNRLQISEGLIIRARVVRRNLNSTQMGFCMTTRFKKQLGSPTGKFTTLNLYVVDAPAWRAVKTTSHSLFILLCLEWGGPKYNNNGKITLSVRQAAERMGVSRDTAAKAFRELQAKGFIVVTKGGSLGVTGHGKCPEYEITSIAMPHQDKSNLFLDWTPGNDFDVFAHPVKNPNGKNKSLS